jgi:1-acyl-sn-glycerol-3-phosphate acyltransferase
MRGPVIVVANHISNADPPLVGGWLAGGLGRRLAFLAKEQLFRGVWGRFMLSQGMIPVRAGRSDVDALRQARSVLERGGIIVVFPEGTRSPDGVIGEAFPGAAMLAARGDTWISEELMARIAALLPARQQGRFARS